MRAMMEFLGLMGSAVAFFAQIALLVQDHTPIELLPVRASMVWEFTWIPLLIYLGPALCIGGLIWGIFGRNFRLFRSIKAVLMSLVLAFLTATAPDMAADPAGTMNSLKLMLESWS